MKAQEIIDTLFENFSGTGCAGAIMADTPLLFNRPNAKKKKDVKSSKKAKSKK